MLVGTAGLAPPQALLINGVAVVEAGPHLPLDPVETGATGTGMFSAPAGLGRVTEERAAKQEALQRREGKLPAEAVAAVAVLERARVRMVN